MEEKPVLKVRLLPDRTLQIKLPRKGAKWQGGFKTMEEAVQKAFKEGLAPPFDIDYVDRDEE